MNLKELQTEFQNIMLNAECAGAPWVDESAHDLSSRDRMNIYHNAYRIRLIDVLLDTFEHTSIYLGDNWFRQLAADYVQTHNSVHTNIGVYGKAFPDFLADQLAADGEISELAILDWTLRRAFDGRDCAVMTQHDLQALASNESNKIQGLRLQPVPTLAIIIQRFNTLDIWHAINTEQQPPEAIQLLQPMNVLTWRKGHSPHFRSLGEMEFVSLSAVCAGNSLDETGALLDKKFPDVDVATEFGGMLQRWLDDEILMRC